MKASNPLEQAGLQAGDYRSDDLQLGQLTAFALHRLRSLQSCSELNTVLAESGWQLPQRVNQSIGQDPSIMCLAPNDWLWFSENLQPTQLQDQLSGQLSKHVAPQKDASLTALYDQSSAFAVFRLSGPAATWLLSKCCGLDFRSAIAQGQHCARTRLNQAPAILHYHRPGRGSGPFVFDVLVERSLARYSWQLFHRLLPHAHELQQQYGPLD
jgi:heterotetrameric sarcosine oxidase gamma subunit